MIELYCDGSYPRRGGPGGWAFVVRGPLKHQESGAEQDATNNRMELIACKRGLEFLEREGFRGSELRIVSDSQYLIKGLNEWGFQWRRVGWRRRDRDGSWTKVKNVDLWRPLFALAHETFHPTFEWVRGHDGHEMNELCDKLAGEAAWSMIDR